MQAIGNATVVICQVKSVLDFGKGSHKHHISAINGRILNHR